MKTAQTDLHRERNGRECRAEEEGSSPSLRKLVFPSKREGQSHLVLTFKCPGLKAVWHNGKSGVACSKVSGMEVLNHT